MQKSASDALLFLHLDESIRVDALHNRQYFVCVLIVDDSPQHTHGAIPPFTLCDCHTKTTITQRISNDFVTIFIVR